MAVTASQRLMSQRDKGKFTVSFLKDSIVDFDGVLPVRAGEGFFYGYRFSDSSGEGDGEGAAERVA